ncbi:MAG: DJ-1/PfpI family protein [Verrucomicrobiales bacterium]|jgi:4-methyl-5(b-hydroxyethyl)-thiazole monophosphate biosynthesis|nr:DJ-1/PfpI family protein [Verrucomicrobiales bacterium]
MSRPFAILVPLADGFEEIEAIVPVDVWRRAGFAVTTAALAANPVTAARRTRHLADTALSAAMGREFDLIYLPGGQPGADALAADVDLLEKLRRHAAGGRWLAAICAAPLALRAAGLLRDKQFTCHPSVAADLTGSAAPSAARVVVDGKLITGRAAGAAFELALTVVRLVGGAAAAAEVNQGLLCHPALLTP